MCLAIPARIVEFLPDNMANVELGGITREISIALVEDLKLDDYVIVHVGHALQKLDKAEALETLAIIEQAIALVGERP